MIIIRKIIEKFVSTAYSEGPKGRTGREQWEQGFLWWLIKGAQLLRPNHVNYGIAKYWEKPKKKNFLPVNIWYLDWIRKNIPWRSILSNNVIEKQMRFVTRQKLEFLSKRIDPKPLNTKWSAFSNKNLVIQRDRMRRLSTKRYKKACRNILLGKKVIKVKLIATFPSKKLVLQSAVMALASYLLLWSLYQGQDTFPLRSPNHFPLHQMQRHQLL